MDNPRLAFFDAADLSKPVWETNRLRQIPQTGEIIRSEMIGEKEVAKVIHTPGHKKSDAFLILRTPVYISPGTPSATFTQ